MLQTFDQEFESPLTVHRSRKEYHRLYYAKRKAEVIEGLGGKCIKCGSKENLEFDHINPHDKAVNITSVIKGKPKREEELKKCQLLCCDCHRDKTGRTEHGKLGMYRHHKCRCDLCVCAERDYQKEYHKTYKRKSRAKKINGGVV